MAQVKVSNLYYKKDLKRLYSFLTSSKVKALNLKKNYVPTGDKFDCLYLENLVGDLEDVQSFLIALQSSCKAESRMIVTYYNHLWEPLLKFASSLGWRRVDYEQNWLDNRDIANLLDLAGFEVINQQRRFLIPVEIPYLADFVNRWLAHLPLINLFCLTTWAVARPKPKSRRDYSVSIVVPAKNEEGNIPKIVRSIPKFGRKQEIIFVEGHSKDKTWGGIQKELKRKYPGYIKVKAFKQRGKGKADAVRLGFQKATSEMLMILDADLSVNPKDLPKFYEVLATGQGEFVNGSRLVYPMEKKAMGTLNKLGNKIFSWLFTWILGQHFKDTLCGTKVLFKKDYEKIAGERKFLSDLDPFGDFDLIFGAVKGNLKVVEVPVRYRERDYGSTNISRFKHGWLLLKMTWVAFRKFRAW